jgi:dihydroorotate dehydrogenase
MSVIEIAAKFDKYFRKPIATLPASIPIHLYSSSRRWFLKNYFSDLPKISYSLPESLQQKFFGLTFQSPLFNAAGIFKEGVGYEVVRRQGAGAFLIGTATPQPRKGNFKDDFYLPFLPLPRSKSALNWLGLPNAGFNEIAKRIQYIEKKPNCPIGISIAANPDDTGDNALSNLLAGFNIFAKTQVDFIELNESCPNVAHEHNKSSNSNLDPLLIKRLQYISEQFLIKRQKCLPVFVKFSVDIMPEQIYELIPLLVDLHFNGINIGNTSTNYQYYKKFLNPKEIPNFEFFINKFGGGFSGKPLKETSLEKVVIANQTLKNVNPKDEFIIIRTGGIESQKDILESKSAGIALNQWFTSYFENFASSGHRVYKDFFQ